ncbi:MAG: TIM barrel protein [Pseudomonadota bacterium]
MRNLHGIESFALNHVSAPSLGWREFSDLAQGLGCKGIELRNDLPKPIFEGDDARDVGLYCADNGLRILALAEVYGFNELTPEIEMQTAELAKLAQLSGAESIVLIPRKGGGPVSYESLCGALERLGEVLSDHGVRGLVEPLGFQDSTLRDFSQTRRAIRETHGAGVFGIVHDTFHHHLAKEDALSAEYVSIIHVSGVSEFSDSEFQDADRVLVEEQDRLGTVDQLAKLIRAGCTASVSYEIFAQGVQNDPRRKENIRKSMDFVAQSVASRLGGDAALNEGSGMENA